MYIKYYMDTTNNNMQQFAELLRTQMGVDAVVVQDGIVLDLDAFNQWQASDMPHWAYLHRKYINSKLHHRQATMEEVDSLMHDTRYTLKAILGTFNKWKVVATGRNLDELQKQADRLYCLNETPIMIIDNETKEAVYAL